MIVDVIVYDPARGGERVDQSCSLERALAREEWVNSSPRSKAAGVFAIVRRT